MSDFFLSNAFAALNFVDDLEDGIGLLVSSYMVIEGETEEINGLVLNLKPRDGSRVAEIVLISNPLGELYIVAILNILFSFRSNI